MWNLHVVEEMVHASEEIIITSTPLSSPPFTPKSKMYRGDLSPPLSQVCEPHTCGTYMLMRGALHMLDTQDISSSHKE